MFNKGKTSKRKNQKEKKSKFQSKSITRIVVSLLIAILAWIAATSFESYILSDKNVTTVVVASKDIKTGTLIDSSNVNTYFTTRQVNSNMVTAKTIQDASIINGKVLSDITAGEMVTTSRFKYTKNVNDSFTDPVEITFMVDATENAVCGDIREGDIVDIVAISKGENESSTISESILKNVYILAAYDSSAIEIENGNTESKATFFKIYVERTEAERLNKIFNESQISVVKLPL